MTPSLARYPDRSRTIALIKSKAIADGYVTPIIQTILCCGAGGMLSPDLGLSIVLAEHKNLTRAQAEAFYGEHAGRPYFEGLIDSVTGPEGVIAMELDGAHLPAYPMGGRAGDAITHWRHRMGPTDPAKAREMAPCSIRALYASYMPHTAVHGSDSPEAVERERAILFGEDLTDRHVRDNLCAALPRTPQDAERLLANVSSMAPPASGASRGIFHRIVRRLAG